MKLELGHSLTMFDERSMGVDPVHVGDRLARVKWACESSQSATCGAIQGFTGIDL